MGREDAARGACSEQAGAGSRVVNTRGPRKRRGGAEAPEKSKDVGHTTLCEEKNSLQL